MPNDEIVILDTSLRDGEQSPGISLSVEDKVDIAKMLERLGVDVIEAGFAVSGQADFEAIRAVATAVTSSKVCSLSRAVESDIELSAEAVRPARRHRIHIVLATSDLHMAHKLRMRPEDVLAQGVAAVRHARKFADDVEFSCEDASRSNIDFLCRFVEAIIDAGATTVSLPDTVGYAMPLEYGGMFQQLRNRVPNIDRVVLSAHCHDDLGLAVSNSLTAVVAGARQVECTINGIGERAGNASLEEIVMALRTRRDYFGVDTAIETEHLVATSGLVSERTGFAVPPNKAIVGRNAFAHASGIHQDGMLKHPGTYQIMAAADVGWGEHRLVLGKHSGRSGFRKRMQALGVEFDSDSQLDAAFRRFKRMAETKAVLEAEDLLETVQAV